MSVSVSVVFRQGNWSKIWYALPALHLIWMTNRLQIAEIAAWAFASQITQGDSLNKGVGVAVWVAHLITICACQWTSWIYLALPPIACTLDCRCACTFYFRLTHGFLLGQLNKQMPIFWSVEPLCRLLRFHTVDKTHQRQTRSSCGCGLPLHFYGWPVYSYLIAIDWKLELPWKANEIALDAARITQLWP